MLIINADDWGKNSIATDRILLCYKNDRVTSVSAMVFMADSERAAEIALENNLNTGLHLNFSLGYNGNVQSSKLKDYQLTIASFLTKSKYSMIMYNPRLTKQFDFVYKAQWEEYIRLYHQQPEHINGHQHFHLCMNILFGKVIPKGQRLRRNFTFYNSEKFIANILYRNLVDHYLETNYICTRYFFDICPYDRPERLEKVKNLSQLYDVELMVHPERDKEFSFLLSDVFQHFWGDIKKGTYSIL